MESRFIATAVLQSIECTRFRDASICAQRYRAGASGSRGMYAGGWTNQFPDESGESSEGRVGGMQEAVSAVREHNYPIENYIMNSLIFVHEKRASKNDRERTNRRFNQNMNNARTAKVH